MSPKREKQEGITRRNFLETIALTGTVVLTGGALLGDQLVAQTLTPKTEEKDPSRANCIDVHHHYVPPTYLSSVKLPGNLLPPLQSWTPTRCMEDMDRAGTATAILSITTPGVWLGETAPSRQLARTCNEYAARMVADNGKRYGMWVALPLPDVDGALREIEYGLDVLKADGVGFFTSYDDKYLGDPIYAPVLEELNRRKAVLYTHPRACSFCAGLMTEMNEAAIEYGTDTTRTIASLVFSGAATRYPDIRFIFSHAGGTMPFLIERFERNAKVPEMAARLPHGVMYELQRFYYDTAQTANPVAMSALTKVVPVSQVLFGTDFPYRTSQDHVTGLGRCGFTAEQLRAIYRDNALRLLPRLSEARVNTAAASSAAPHS
jgi:predicted TIM-barrel fold metal-dependent hydrolase